jgi:ankyrin repeat protein
MTSLDANLAVESLNQPRAFTMPFHKLMSEFPDKMTGLYEQELQALDPDTRHVLMVALRWAVCGEGRISATPVADEIEGTYLAEDSETDEDEDEDEDEVEAESEQEDAEGNESVEEDVGTNKLGVNATDEGNQEVKPDELSGDATERSTRNYNGSDRDSAPLLHKASRNFLKFDQDGYMSLQHASVRDFIMKEANEHIHHEDTLCPKCRERFGSLSTVEAGPKQGHLLMAIYCLKNLNARSFQKKFLPLQILRDHNPDSPQESGGPADGANDVPNSAEPATAEEDLGTEATVSRSSTGFDLKPQTEIDDTTLADNDVDVIDHDATALEESAPTPGLPADGWENNDDDAISAYAPTDSGSVAAQENVNQASNDGMEIRYELKHWHYHVRQAEKECENHDERNMEDWDLLYELIDKFLGNTDILRVWQKIVIQGRVFKRWDEPIHCAARFGILHYMEDYVAMGGDVNVVNENNATPLAIACAGLGEWIGIEFLIEHQADLSIRTTILENLPIHWLIDAGGPAKTLKYLLDHGADPTEPRSRLQTPLHCAVRNRNYENVEVLLSHPDVDVNVRDDEGETPLHWLFWWPNAPDNILKLLLDNGANVNEQDSFSQAPLYETCLSGNVTAARRLLEKGAAVNDEEETFGRTALHQAIQGQNMDMVTLLLEFKADVLIKDKQLRDAINVAAYKDDELILKAVLEALKAQGKSGDSLKDPDIQGHTPLHRAAARGKKEIAQLILDAGDGVALTTRTNGKGNTPLHSAARRGHWEIVELLVSRGADFLTKNRQSHTAIDLAVHGWRKLGLFDGNDFRKTVGFLLQKGSKASADVIPGLLDVAIETGAVEICASLIETEKDGMDKEDRHGWSPLMLACQTQHAEIIHLLRPFDNKELLERYAAKQHDELGTRPSVWSRLVQDKYKRLAVSEDGLQIHRTFGSKLNAQLAQIAWLADRRIQLPGSGTREFAGLTTLCRLA